jgi:hypothetical protein
MSPSIVGRRKRVTLLAVVVALNSCGREVESGSRTEISPRSTPHIALVATSAPGAAFTNVTSVDVDSRGEVYVSDFPSSTITVLSGDGSVVRRIGRRGDGPAEFRYISTVQILPGDSLLVYDQGLNRVTVFSPHEDQVAYTINLSEKSRKAPPYWMRKLPEQQALLAAYREPFSASGNPGSDVNRKEVLALLQVDGSVSRDSLVVFPAQEFLVARRGGMVSVGQSPFGRRSVFGVGARGRIYIGWTDTLGLDVYSPEGRRIDGFRESTASPEVTSSDVREVEAKLGPEFRRVLDSSVPETWPAVRSFLVDDRDRLWVTLTGERKKGETGMVFSRSGARLATLHIPEELDIRVVRNGLVYGVEKDGDDIPRVVIHRLTHPSLR